VTQKIVYICAKKFLQKNMKSIFNQILKGIYGHGRGWVLTPNDFEDLGSRNAIASALERHKQSRRIRQLARGLYDYPKSDPPLGLLLHPADDLPTP